MIKLLRTNSKNKDFLELITHLDAELKIRDGDNHDFYDQFNKLDNIKNVVVAYENESPIGCGAFKIYQNSTIEIKRMYVSLLGRRKGVATKVLNELENWAKELNFTKCILETGIQQPEAIELYKKCGYTITPNFGFYENAENSVCFEKIIK
ncbi:GNAT family N-acetyltransferase [Lutibacter sp. B1]|uniref:GNAT family N-acetyltransferase n=1 Tax=Lutibacter sp. B1 TaxID=2725996 RepID=UPI0014566A6F|nr:GNAT family N-acetyltransferase [Lutibacter sp. B1]NLP57286.1 GNAT family N-acetyltransferase [Lutibacter sp. B1]